MVEDQLPIADMPDQWNRIADRWNRFADEIDANSARIGPMLEQAQVRGTGGG